MLFGLSEAVILKIHFVLRNHPHIEKAILYGSRAKGNYREGSDIDLTLLGNLFSRELGQIADEIDDLLLPYTFDLSIYDSLKSKSLKDHIQRVGKVFYEREAFSPIEATAPQGLHCGGLSQ